MRSHLLRVETGPEAFVPLLRAAAQVGLRVGWLELAADAAALTPVPAGLETAADAGALRAVAVGPGGSVAIKPRRGEAVLGDLLREHFRGCALVLVLGAVAAPRLAAEDEDSWTIHHEHGTARCRTEELLADLRKPQPWGREEGGEGATERSTRSAQAEPARSP